jgi:hypothetical protein
MILILEVHIKLSETNKYSIILLSIIENLQ